MDLLKIDVDIVLSHPLPGYPEYTGFDVRGIFITDGSLDGLSIDNGLVFPKAEESRLLNADGYTRWWNPREFHGPGILGYSDGLIGTPDGSIGYDSTVNGYKYFADGLGADEDIMSPLVLQGRGRFSSSSTNRRNFSLRFGPYADNFMIFNYAVDASWERPEHVPPLSFDDFPVSANAFEPFNIGITELVNTLYYDPSIVNCPESGGTIRLRIEVASWRGAEGISSVMVGSPDLGFNFTAPVEVGSKDEFEAYVGAYEVEITPGPFTTDEPEIIIAAETPYGSYTTGPEGLAIPFTGSGDIPLALYHVYIPTVGINSPPVVGPINGSAIAVAGVPTHYEVEEYFDCQDTNADLAFAWEIGDDDPPLYNNGFGNIDGVFTQGDGSIEIIFPDEGIYTVDVRVRDIDGSYGYTEQPLEVEVILPALPEFPVEPVNLELALRRTAYHSYEYTNNPSDVPAIELYWEGSTVTGNIEEWVIYRDEDPYDGIEEWLEIGTTPYGVTFFPNLLTGEYGYDSGASYYFMVKARGVIGNPNSESNGSTEWAFIEFENGEPEGATADLHYWIMGYGGYESYYFRQFEMPGYGGAISGSCWMMDPDSDYMRRHLWSVIASQELPILADPTLAQTTEEWYIELVFGGQVIPMNECWDNYGRLSVGTTPDSPSIHTGQSRYTGYDEASPDDYMDGSPYYTTAYWSAVNSRFDETTSSYNDRYGWGKDEFGWPFNWARYRLVDLDPNGAGRTRAAIGFGSGATTDAHARPRVDEIAVIIY